jgi:hypothetical protein
MDEYRIGTIMIMSATYGSQTKELMTVVSPSTSTSHDPLSDLLIELQELWPLVQPI